MEKISPNVLALKLDRYEVGVTIIGGAVVVAVSERGIRRARLTVATDDAPKHRHAAAIVVGPGGHVSVREVV